MRYWKYEKGLQWYCWYNKETKQELLLSRSWWKFWQWEYEKGSWWVYFGPFCWRNRSKY